MNIHSYLEAIGFAQVMFDMEAIMGKSEKSNPVRGIDMYMMIRSVIIIIILCKVTVITFTERATQMHQWDRYYSHVLNDT